jgi:plastocyanin
MKRRLNSAHIAAFAFFLSVVVTCYSCGSSTPNTTAATVSSASARIVTCPASSVTAVSIVNFAFQPGSVSIAVNDIVKWTNNDSTAHTATSGAPGALDGKFDTGNLAPNATACVQFLAAGSYNYFCNIHTFMTGTVIVQ